MSWKITVLQSLVLIGLSYLAIQYFTLHPLGTLQFQQEELSTDLSSLTEKISSLEQKILSHPPLPTRNAAFPGKLETALYQRIRALEQRESELEETIA